MFFRTRYQKLGGHYHVRVFSSKTANGTFAKLGDLTMDEKDWPAFQTAFKAEHLEEPT